MVWEPESRRITHESVRIMEQKRQVGRCEKTEACGFWGVRHRD